MIKIGHRIVVEEGDIDDTYVTAQGPGGQNVNKVATAAALRFNLWAAPGVPWDVKTRAARSRQAPQPEREIVILAQRFRSQERNRADAIERLAGLLEAAAEPPKPRVATKPTYASRVRRVDENPARDGEADAAPATVRGRGVTTMARLSGGCPLRRSPLRVRPEGGIADFCHCGRCRRPGARRRSAGSRSRRSSSPSPPVSPQIRERRRHAPVLLRGLRFAALHDRPGRALGRHHKLARIDDVEAVRPTGHGWDAARPSWLVLCDGLPRFPGEMPYDA